MPYDSSVALWKAINKTKRNKDPQSEEAHANLHTKTFGKSFKTPSSSNHFGSAVKKVTDRIGNAGKFRDANS